MKNDASYNNNSDFSSIDISTKKTNMSKKNHNDHSPILIKSKQQVVNNINSKRSMEGQDESDLENDFDDDLLLTKSEGTLKNQSNTI